MELTRNLSLPSVSNEMVSLAGNLIFVFPSLRCLIAPGISIPSLVVLNFSCPAKYKVIAPPAIPLNRFVLSAAFLKRK